MNVDLPLTCFIARVPFLLPSLSSVSVFFLSGTMFSQGISPSHYLCFHVPTTMLVPLVVLLVCVLIFPLTCVQYSTHHYIAFISQMSLKFIPLFQNPHVMGHACNPSTRETEAGGLLSSRSAWATK